MIEGLIVRSSFVFGESRAPAGAARRGNVALRTSRPGLTADPLGYLQARSELQPSGCVLWTGGVTVKGFGAAGDGDYAHRVAWSVYHGAPAPRGKHVGQTCGDKLCIAREHLHLTKQRRSNGPNDPHSFTTIFPTETT